MLWRAGRGVAGIQRIIRQQVRGTVARDGLDVDVVEEQLVRVDRHERSSMDPSPDANKRATSSAALSSLTKWTGAGGSHSATSHRAVVRKTGDLTSRQTPFTRASSRDACRSWAMKSTPYEKQAFEPQPDLHLAQVEERREILVPVENTGP